VQTVGTKVSAGSLKRATRQSTGKRAFAKMSAPTPVHRKSWESFFAKREREIEHRAFGVSTQSPGFGRAIGGALKLERTTRTSADRHCPFDHSLRIPLN